MRGAALTGLAVAMVASLAGCRDKSKASTAIERDRPLVVFLHGVYDGKSDPDAERVRDRLRAAGFAVYTPTRKQGLCDWSEDVKRSVCWPSDERTLEKARVIVREWGPSLSPSQPTVVVGFSNGGALATLLATHGLVAGRAADWESGQMSATSAQLETLGWPHETKTHEGGHAVSDQDLDAAIAFAKSAVRDCKPDR